MPHHARRVSSGLACSRPGLLALFLLLTVPRLSLAQAVADQPQPQTPAEPAPTPAPSAPPPGYYYPPPGYYSPPPGYYSPPGGPAETSPYPPALYESIPAVPNIAAQPAPPAAQTPPRFTFGATLGTTAESEPGSTSVVFSPLLEGAYQINPGVLLDLAWGFGWLVDNQGIGESTARVGNPMLSGFYRNHFKAWRLRAGLGITAPLAHQPLEMDGRLDAFLFNQTMAMNGMWNAWLWTPDRMAVPVSARADYALAAGYGLAAEGAIAPVIGVRNGASGTDVLGQIALEARLPLGASFDLCPRFQTVLLPKTSFDRLQSAFELRGSLKTEHGRYFAGVLFNLDQPLGIFSGLNRWGIHLGKEIDL
jgi:hypothetical protein